MPVSPITPVVLGAVGTAVGKIFQRSSQKHSEQKELARQKAKERETEMAEDTAKAMEIFEDVTKKTDSRLTVMDRIYTAILRGDKEYEDSMWDRYIEIMWRWRSEETLTFTLIEAYFGHAVLTKYEEIMTSFRSLGQDLQNVTPEGDYAFEGEYENIRIYLRALNDSMIKLIHDKEVGRFLPERSSGSSS